MLNIGIQAVPNQSLSVTVATNFFNIILKQAYDAMYCTVSLNNVLLISNVRLVSGQPMIPYEYLQTGNFILLTENNALPFWTKFGITQSLVYLSAEELSEISAGV